MKKSRAKEILERIDDLTIVEIYLLEIYKYIGNTLLKKNLKIPYKKVEIIKEKHFKNYVYYRVKYYLEKEMYDKKERQELKIKAFFSFFKSIYQLVRENKFYKKLETTTNYHLVDPFYLSTFKKNVFEIKIKILQTVELQKEEIPRYLYHMTDKRLIPLIKKYGGLKPGYRGYSKGKIFFSPKLPSKEFSFIKLRDPIIFKLDRKKLSPEIKFFGHKKGAEIIVKQKIPYSSLTQVDFPP